MQDYYNMNQTTLSIALDYQPEEHHSARYINQLVESLKLKYDYQFGRPREYNLGAMLKLVLLAYSYGIFSSRKIEQFARENKPAGWLIADQIPSYRTICRFRISDELATLTTDSLSQLTQYLRQNGMIDDVSFIDGTKILADANKYSFVWKKNTIRFDKMNREKLVDLLGELHEAKIVGEIPAGSELTPELLDIMISKVEDHLVVLNETGKQLSRFPRTQPNSNAGLLNHKNVSWINDVIKCVNTKHSKLFMINVTATLRRITMPPLCGSRKIRCKTVN
ncbi:transposase [Lactiplantibacillus plantarum]|nr:transposase [Lactiplantibacillus plantarum]